MSPERWHCDSQQSELRFAQFFGRWQARTSLRYTARSGRCTWSRPSATSMDVSGKSRCELLRSSRANRQALAAQVKAVTVHGAPLRLWKAHSGPRIGPCRIRHPAKIHVDQYPGRQPRLLHREVEIAEHTATSRLPERVDIDFEGKADLRAEMRARVN